MPCLVHHKIGKLAPIVIDDSLERALRDGSQTAAFKALRDKQLTILNAPTGWGKSIITLFILAWKLIKNPKLRCVIVVPQTVISKGFLEDIRFKVRGRWVNWSVGHNLCHVRADKRVEALGRFLRRRRQETLSDRVLVCTHTTLSAAYNELPSHVFKNLVLWIDEAHHVMNGDVEDGSVRRNTLGKVLSQCIENGCDVGLATATLMRGDLRQILSEESERKFVAHKVPYDVYFKESPPVESFSIDLLCGDKEKSLRSILKTKQKTIIYLPKRNSHFASCKLKERDAIFKILARGGKIKKGPIITQCGTQRVIDLIDTTGRRARQQHIMNNGDVDVIIALETCKEGFDWPAAERSIMIGERKSIPELVQMVGRLFRRAPDKTHASIYQVMPGVKSGDKFKDQRNRIWTSIFAAMLLEDFLIPLKFCKPLAETVSNSSAAQSLWRDFLVAIKGLTYDQSLDRMASVLEGRVPKVDWKARWKGLWEQLWKLIYSVRGLHIDVSFEVLKNMDVMDELLLISSDLCGIKTFEELRDAIGRSRKTGGEFEALLLEITKGGKSLPCCRDLGAQHGCGFVGWWGRNKHRFPGIEQESINSLVLKKHEALLRELTKGGKSLPSGKELADTYGHGFHGWWKKNKHRFPGITQNHQVQIGANEVLLREITKDGKRLPRWQDLADKYSPGFQAWWTANKYKFPEIRQESPAVSHEDLLLEITQGNKVLPCHKELKDKYGGGFTQWLAVNRRRFPEIHQDHEKSQASDHESLLRKITKGGKILSSYSSLKYKYGGSFVQWWAKNAHRFPEVNQNPGRVTHTAAHHESLFIDITKDGKSLPPSKRLIEKYGHGFRMWCAANRHRFPEIIQEKLIIPSEEHEAFLSEITKDSKSLPPLKELASTYGGGFSAWWQKNKHRFPEISQERLKAPSKTDRRGHEALLLEVTKDGKSLPCQSELSDTYSHGFSLWWRKNKHRFPKITQHARKKQSSEHEALLLELTKDSCMLPAHVELQNKYGGGFVQWWHKNKHRFPEVNQKTLTTCSEEYESLLLEITKDGTPLPGCAALKVERGENFEHWWRTNKQRFPGIEQESFSQKTAKKHGSLLLQITEGGNLLPSYTELRVKYGAAFASWWSRHQDQFPHIKQVRRIKQAKHKA